MRYKLHTIEKLDAQQTRLESLRKYIENGAIKGPEAVKFIESIQKELQLVIERLGLERDE